MLKVDNISTGYGKKQVLFNVSVEVAESEIVLLAGSNGSGKSTLLKAIFGLLPLWNDGKVLFNSQDISGKPTASLLKRGILYIPQKNNLFHDLTVLENLQMAGLSLSGLTLKHQVDYVLSIFPKLSGMLNSVSTNLSGGERQLLVFAMAMLHDPKLLLIDEPLVGLSAANITLVLNALKSLSVQKHVAMLIVEHRISECCSIADRMIGLKLGKVFNNLQTKEKFNKEDLDNLYI